MPQARVVVVGGGTVGLEVARRLERRSREIDLTIVDSAGSSVYQPLLPEVAGGVIDPRHAVLPLRTGLRHAQVIDGTACALDASARRLGVRRLSGDEIELSYDHLVVAPGAVTKLLPVPGLAERAIGFQTVAEALRLRDHVLGRLQWAESCTDTSRRAQALTFVFVGGGYSGVEAVGELADLAADACRDHPAISPDDVRFVLVEATDAILPMVRPALRAAALHELRSRGIDVRLETLVESVDGETIHMSDGTSLAADTLVWCAGVRAHPTVAELGLPSGDQDEVEVDATLAVQGLDGVWSAGDCAAVPDLVRGGTCPPSAQYALRQGRQIARNIERALAGHAPRKFRYRQIGELISLGRMRAVGEIRGLRLTGRPAWFLRAAYHVFRFPTWQRKLRIGLEWTISAAFPRETTSLGFARDVRAPMEHAIDAVDDSRDQTTRPLL
jgi:NADH:ubiquinone reductase (H+-translocating)